MCGIAGIIGKNANEAFLRDILFPILHRGEPLYRNELQVIDSIMAIATHRLAIVDEHSGKQPIQAQDRKVYCVFNGEIYNHADLRKKLSHISFKSECDSEVVLYAYLQWGDEFVQHLDGKFAIAIFDQEKNTLILARDPMGIKPLYYAKLEDDWVFASELKSLTILNDRLSQIVELEPGALWKNNIVEPYFKLVKFSAETTFREPVNFYTEKLKQYLKTAVQKRIPEKSSKIACLLSGGVDSSIITYLAKLSHPNVVAYTLAAPHMPSADLLAAKELCRQFDIEHIIVSPPVHEMQEFYLTEGVYMTESFEPVLVRNAVSYHFLCRRVVADGFKFCLNGEGSDELFGGYDFVREAPIHIQDDVIWHSLSIIHKTYLQMADRASMYATLEARVPFMDKDLIAFCLSLPKEARIFGSHNKFLLRESYKNDLPESIAFRRKTGMNEGAGFGINASQESIYYQAVREYYETNQDKLKEDSQLCKEIDIEGKINAADIEEVYLFARFIELNFNKLKQSYNRLQLNTKLKTKLQSLTVTA